LDQLILAIAQRLAAACGLPVAELVALIEVPPDEKMGDLALPCFRLAGKLKKKPPEVAAEFAAALAGSGSPVAGASAAGAYVNIRLDRAALAAAVLGDVSASPNGLPILATGNCQLPTAVIEFSSPNIAKPFTVALLRGTALGAALSRIHEALGFKVVRCDYFGDWGTQFGKVITAFRKWGSEEKLKSAPIGHLLELYVRFGEEARNDPSLDEAARAVFKKLEDGSAEEFALWERFRSLSVAEFERVYARLGIKFDSYDGEAYYRNKVQAGVDFLRARGLVEQSQGATVVNLEKQKLGVMLLLKSDDASIYASRDVAAALDRQERYRFGKLIYVVGADQKLHFQQLFKSLEMAGCEWAKVCRHVDFGLVLIGGEKMSTRAGKVVLLGEVLDKAAELAAKIIAEKNPEMPNKERAAEAVGVGAVTFTSLVTRRNKDVDFAWERILSFDGETGPYLQYTHARLCSILRKAGGAPTGAVDLKLLATDEEHSVVKQLGRMSRVLADSAENCEPALLASWCLDLAGAANRFYNQHRVIGEDAKLTAARLALVDAVRRRLRAGLELLGLVALEEM
jgi:arginyl-tRNA synthetase